MLTEDRAVMREEVVGVAETDGSALGTVAGSSSSAAATLGLALVVFAVGVLAGFVVRLLWPRPTR